MRTTRTILQRHIATPSRLAAFLGRQEHASGPIAAAWEGRRATSSVVGLIVLAMVLAGLAWGAVAMAADEGKDKPKEEGFVPLFNGKDLAGWEGDKKLWIVEDGALVGRSPGIPHNDFLATAKEYGDFVLRLEVRLRPDNANSGVQFRSKRVPNSHEVSGYQADISAGWWGKLYDESRRNKVLAGPSDETIKKLAKPGEWNAYEIRAVGDRITLKLNGTTTVEFTETEPAEKVARRGIFAVQIHGGGPLEVRFRNIRIKELKEPPSNRP